MKKFKYSANILKERKKSAIGQAVAEVYRNKCTVGLYDVEKFDTFIVNDEKSCFRKNNSNRHHYELLKNIPEVKLCVIYSPEGKPHVRFWLWSLSMGLVAHNFYGNISSKDFPKYLKALGDIFYISDVPCCVVEQKYSLPIYTNDNKILLYGNDHAAIMKELQQLSIFCPSCQSKTPLGDLVENQIAKEFYCINCAPIKVQCNHCGKVIPEMGSYIFAGYYFCTSCYIDVISICDGCGRITWKAELITNPKGMLLCQSCIKTM